MSFGGSAQAMNEAIKRNKRPRKKAFENWRKLEKEYKTNGGSKIVLNNEQKVELRKKLKKKAKKRLIKEVVLWVLSIAISAFVIFKIINAVEKL